MKQEEWCYSDTFACYCDTFWQKTMVIAQSGGNAVVARKVTAIITPTVACDSQYFIQDDRYHEAMLPHLTLQDQYFQFCQSTCRAEALEECVHRNGPPRFPTRKAIRANSSIAWTRDASTTIHLILRSEYLQTVRRLEISPPKLGENVSIDKCCKR